LNTFEHWSNVDMTSAARETNPVPRVPDRAHVTLAKSASTLTPALRICARGRATFFVIRMM
jgi:hypothetical protein